MGGAAQGANEILLMASRHRHPGTTGAPAFLHRPDSVAEVKTEIFNFGRRVRRAGGGSTEMITRWDQPTAWRT